MFRPQINDKEMLQYVALQPMHIHIQLERMISTMYACIQLDQDRSPVPILLMIYNFTKLKIGQQSPSFFHVMPFSVAVTE